jgi:hypothetical protein
MTKKHTLWTAAIVCITASILFGMSYFENASRARELEAILDVVYTTALAAKSEYGTFPQTLEDIRFVPSCAEFVVKYKSEGNSFIATITDKRSGESLSISSSGDKAYFDKLMGIDAIECSVVEE